MKLYCRDCHQVFEFSEGEQAFYTSKRWASPIRCPECRKANKAHRSDPYFGFESTMGCGYALKSRHTRVHYPPHVVGGFR